MWNCSFFNSWITQFQILILFFFICVGDCYDSSAEFQTCSLNCIFLPRVIDAVLIIKVWVDQLINNSATTHQQQLLFLFENNERNLAKFFSLVAPLDLNDDENISSGQEYDWDTFLKKRKITWLKTSIIFFCSLTFDLYQGFLTKTANVAHISLKKTHF